MIYIIDSIILIKLKCHSVFSSIHRYRESSVISIGERSTLLIINALEDPHFSK